MLFARADYIARKHLEGNAQEEFLRRVGCGLYGRAIFVVQLRDLKRSAELVG